MAPAQQKTCGESSHVVFIHFQNIKFDVKNINMTSTEKFPGFLEKHSLGFLKIN
jgi:hypothetical protein